MAQMNEEQEQTMREMGLLSPAEPSEPDGEPRSPQQMPGESPRDSVASVLAASKGSVLRGSFSFGRGSFSALVEEVSEEKKREEAIKRHEERMLKAQNTLDLHGEEDKAASDSEAQADQLWRYRRENALVQHQVLAERRARQSFPEVFQRWEQERRESGSQVLR